MRYFTIALLMIIMVISYVWQNIEVTKINLDYRKLLRTEKRIIKDVDRLKYQIEQFRTMEAMEYYARSHGLRRVKPGDVDVIKIK